LGAQIGCAISELPRAALSNAQLSIHEQVARLVAEMTVAQREAFLEKSPSLSMTQRLEHAKSCIELPITGGATPRQRKSVVAVRPRSGIWQVKPKEAVKHVKQAREIAVQTDGLYDDMIPTIFPIEKENVVVEAEALEKLDRYAHRLNLVGGKHTAEPNALIRPNLLSWEWPLTRQDQKSRVQIIDQQMEELDWMETVQELMQLCGHRRRHSFPSRAYGSADATVS
jgi:hypothetical protein